MPSAVARQARGPSAATSQAISLPLKSMPTTSRESEIEIIREREGEREKERQQNAKRKEDDFILFLE